MNTEQRNGLSGGANPGDRAGRIAEQLAAELQRVAAEIGQARRDRDASADRLREVQMLGIEQQIAAWAAERERQTAEAELARARAHIARMQPVLRQMRMMLATVQTSKFWKSRNTWFAIKRRLRVNLTGPQADWLPELDDTSSRWDEQLPYERWQLARRIRPDDVKRMREIVPLLAQRPAFSVLMPVYDPPEPFLRAAIESVIAQAYPHWELCIADDASPSPYVRAVIEEYAAADARVKTVFRPTNGHISATTNSALALATGDFVALLDHDDLLSPDALFENALAVNRRPDVDVIYSDEDKIDEHGVRVEPYFKPDWSPDSLLSRNYVSHLGVYRRSLVEALGGFREGFEGSQDYDLILRASERTQRIEHIARVLYHWRAHAGSTAVAREQKSYAHDASARALRDALTRRGDDARVEQSPLAAGIYTVRYALRGRPLVSLIVPTRDHGDDVDRCLRSVFERSTYDRFEVVLLDNGSTDRESLHTFGAWLEREPERVRLVPYDVPFNFSRINDHAVAHARGDVLLFLNNDTEVVTPDWIEAMLEQAQRPSIGAVGAKLLYDDGTVQHAGVIVGLGGVAGHSHKYFPQDAPGYFYTLQSVTNFSAVTAACLMVRRAVFDEVGGFDDALAIAFNDVDLCLRIRDAGYSNVYVPHAVLFHHESRSRGAEDTPEKMERFLGEQTVMRERWKTAERPDPFYNPNLTLETENYAIGT